MAIAYSQVVDQEVVNQIVVMFAVAVFITLAVYGFVGLIVKMDDIGVHLAQDKYHPAAQKFGRGIVKFMPHFLTILGYVGTAAMLWVGAEIIAHGFPYTSHLLHDIEHYFANIPALGWFAKALACFLGGLVVGFVIEKLVVLAKKVIPGKK